MRRLKNKAPFTLFFDLVVLIALVQGLLAEEDGDVTFNAQEGTLLQNEAFQQQVEVDPSTNQDQVQQFTGAQSPVPSTETSTSEELNSNEESNDGIESDSGEEAGDNEVEGDGSGDPEDQASTVSKRGASQSGINTALKELRLMSQHRFDPTFRTCRYSKGSKAGEFKDFTKNNGVECNVGDIFKRLFQDMFPDEKNLLASLTRGILSQSGNFVMLPGRLGGKLTVTETYVKIENFLSKSWRTVTTQRGYDWLKFSSISMSQMTIYYDGVSTDKPHLDIEFEGVGELQITYYQSESVDIKKPRSKREHLDDVSDIYISSSATGNLKINTFLKMFGLDSDSVFHRKDKFVNSLKLDNAVFPGGYEPKLKLILMANGAWDAYVSSRMSIMTSGEIVSLTYKFNPLMIYCKSSKHKDSQHDLEPTCGIAALIDLKRIYSDDNIFKLVGVDDDIAEKLAEIPLIKEATAASLHISNHGVEFPNLKEELDEFTPMLWTDESNRLSAYEQFALPGYCFRFRNERTSAILPFIREYEGPMLINACIDLDGNVEIKYPESWTGNKFQYNAGFEKMAFPNNLALQSPNIFGTDVPVKLDSITVSRSDTGKAEVCQNFQPSEKYRLIYEKSTTVFTGAAEDDDDDDDDSGFSKMFMRDTIISQCYDKNQKSKWNFKGNGKEVFWNLEAKVEVKYKGGERVGLTTLDYNVHAAKEVKSRASADYLPEWTKKKFSNLNDFRLGDMKIELFFNKKRSAFFKGRSFLPGFENSRAQFVYFSNEMAGAELAFCAYKSEKAQIAKLLSQMYMPGLIPTWKVFSDGTLIMRQAAKRNRDPVFEKIGNCRTAEEDAKGIFLREDFDGGLIVQMTNLDLSDCHTKNTETYHAVCEFLYIANNRKTLIPGTYYGRIFADHTFMLKSYLTESFTLKIGRFSLINAPFSGGRRGIKHLSRTFTPMKSKANFDYMSGFLKTAGVYGVVKLNFIGENVYLESFESDMNRRFASSSSFGIPFIEMTTFKKNREDITNAHNMEVLELNCDILIGNLPKSDDKIAPTNSQQFIHYTNRFNRLLACVEGLTIKKIFKAFGKQLKHFVGDIEVEGCFTYNPPNHPEGELQWEIKSHDIKAAVGFHFYGSSRGYNNIKISFTDEVQLEMTVPPIIQRMKYNEAYKPKEDPIFDNFDQYVSNKEGEQGETALEFYASKSDYTNGPKLTLTYGSNDPIGTLSGYISLVGYDGSATIDVVKGPRCTNNCPLKVYSLQKNTDLYNEVTGSLNLQGVCDEDECNSFANIEFDLTLDVTDNLSQNLKGVAKELKEEYDLTRTNSLLDTMNSLNAQLKALEHQSKLAADGARQEASVLRMERERAIQAYSKSCVEECPLVSMPGLDVQNCFKAANGRQARCVSFNEDKYTGVSNVGCLSKCESERVQSFAKRRSLDTKAGIASATVSKKQEIADMYANKRSYQAPERKDPFIQQLEKSSSSALKVSKMTANFKFKEIDHPECLPFTVSYMISTPDTSYSRAAADAELTICFGGGDFSANAAHTISHHAFDDELEQLKTFVSEVKLDVPKMIEDLEEEMDSYATKRNEIQSIDDKSLDVSRLSSYPTSNFHVTSEATVASFKKNSPWVLAENKDPYVAFKVAPFRNMSLEKVDENNACAVARNGIDNMQGMMQYVRKWINSYGENQKTMDSVVNFVGSEIANMRNHIETIKRGVVMDSTDEQNMHHWSNITEQGIKRWNQIIDGRIASQDKFAAHFIKSELNRIYGTPESKSFEDFITKMASKASNAYKRMDIPKPKHTSTFSKISTGMVNMLREGSTLASMATDLNGLEKLLENPDKRTLACSMKMF
ncbi:uncharacterized protein [Clytia hemisphaerica]|uniref:Uncharacterized protein n=1 Tax=Clytia hemisphaerica TaxID=252671 RepID=A0A7M5XGK7_9CNID